MKHGLNRRNFIKGIAVAIGGLIGTLIGIPSIAYLFSPSLEVEKNSDSINLGPLEKYPLGIPTRFDFTLTKVNGWERAATNYGLYVLRKMKRAGSFRIFAPT